MFFRNRERCTQVDVVGESLMVFSPSSCVLSEIPRQILQLSMNFDRRDFRVSGEHDEGGGTSRIKSCPFPSTQTHEIGAEFRLGEP